MVAEIAELVRSGLDPSHVASLVLAAIREDTCSRILKGAPR
jgi:hypothetical protein